MEQLDLSDWLTPAAEPSVEGVYMPAEATIGQNLYGDGQVALIGCGAAGSAIRKHLYELSHRFCHIQIADLGDVKGEGEQRSANLEKTVCELLRRGIIPVVMGGEADLTLAASSGLAVKCANQRISIVTPRIAKTPQAGDTRISACNFLNYLEAKPQTSGINLIGLQNYLCAEWQEQATATDQYYRLRLRNINPITLAEPVLRDTDLFCLDLAAIRYADAPAASLPNPNGMSGAEACQLAHFAGMSDTTAVYCLCGLDAAADGNGITASLAAQIAWHIIEGIDNRCGDYPLRPITEYRKYIVLKTTEFDDEKTFYNNPANGRWWVEIPQCDGNRIFACAHTDYTDMTRGAIPDIWMRRFMK